MADATVHISLSRMLYHCCPYPPLVRRCRFLQSKQRIIVWLYDQPDVRVEGRIIGFDEYMNLVLDEAEELSVLTLLPLLF